MLVRRPVYSRKKSMKHASTHVREMNVHETGNALNFVQL